MKRPRNPLTHLGTRGDERTVQAATDILAGRSRRRGLARLLPFMGPAFIASVAYVDPGNFAANIQAGSQFGYLLLWVVIAANLVGMLVQLLSAKLGIATGANLAELCRSRFPRPVVWGLWALMEVVAMSTDLAEFVGAALGLNLLLGIPLWAAGLVAAILTFLILGLQRYGFRLLEIVLSLFIGVIAVSYLIEIVLARPEWGQVFYHAFVPHFGGRDSALLAAAILGATVMPHVIFLHSSLTQGRIVVREPEQMRRLFRFEVADVVVALGLAGLINAAMLMMASATFHQARIETVGTIQQAYLTLVPLLGAAASWVFAISLLASGFSSSSVGTLSGQIIMQGFLHRGIPVWVRRVVTAVPPLIVLFIGLDPTQTLVISQVVLSFGLPFAIVPLVWFTARRDVMGILVNRPVTTVLAVVVAVVVVALNIFLLVQVL